MQQFQMNQQPHGGSEMFVLLEAALGKGIAYGESTTYATPFSTPSVNVIYDQLQRSTPYQIMAALSVPNLADGHMRLQRSFWFSSFFFLIFLKFYCGYNLWQL